VPTVLKIPSHDIQGMVIDIRHLLPHVGDAAADLSWRVLPDFEAVWQCGRETDLKALYEFSDRVEDSENGVDLTWPELQELAQSIMQTVWGKFIGIRPDTPWPNLTDMLVSGYGYIDRTTSSFFDSVDIALMACDNSYWLVYVRDRDVRERVQAAFDNVESIEAIG